MATNPHCHLPTRATRDEDDSDDASPPDAQAPHTGQPRDSIDEQDDPATHLPTPDANPLVPALAAVQMNQHTDTTTSPLWPLAPSRIWIVMEGAFHYLSPEDMISVFLADFPRALQRYSPAVARLPASFRASLFLRPSPSAPLVDRAPPEITLRVMHCLRPRDLIDLALTYYQALALRGFAPAMDRTRLMRLRLAWAGVPLTETSDEAAA